MHFKLFNLCCLILTFTVVTYAAVEISCGDDQDIRYCINDEVQYQCSAPGDDIGMRWRVYNNISQLLGQVTYISREVIGSLMPIFGATDFSTVIVSNGNPLIIKISFTAKMSHNGYKIWCDQIGGENKNCTINIESRSNISMAINLTSKI